MRKTFLLIFAAIWLLSCAKEAITPKDEAPEGVPMSFNISVVETKADKTAWADGDKIYVFFNGMATKYLILGYDGTEWSSTSGGGTLLDSDFSGLGTLTLTAVHFPVAVNVSYAGSKFSFTSGGKPVYNYYFSDAGKAYTVDGTMVSASISLEKPANFVQLHIAGIQATVASYTLGCAQIRPVACKSVGLDGTLTEEVLQAGARLSGFADSDGAVFAGRLNNPSATKYSFSLATDEKIYTLTRTSELTAGTMYNFPVLSDGRWSVQNASDLYVDLGLSVKWAKCNVGASNPQDFGRYYAWGELQPVKHYDWSSYQFGDQNNLNKYTGSDYSVLQREDDTAYAALGGKFRMPTYNEWQELRTTQNNANYTWTWCDGINTKYNNSNKTGWKVVYKPNSNTLFLPAAGLIMLGTQVPSMADFVTYYGYYWSSTHNTTSPSLAKGLFFTNGLHFIDPQYDRTVQLSIRPVYAN